MDDLVMWNDCGMNFFDWTFDPSYSIEELRFAYRGIVTISFSWPFVTIFAFFASCLLPLFIIMLNSFSLSFFFLSLFVFVHSCTKETIDLRVSKLKAARSRHIKTVPLDCVWFIHFSAIISFRLKRIENQFNTFTVNSF